MGVDGVGVNCFLCVFCIVPVFIYVFFVFLCVCVCMFSEVGLTPAPSTPISS